MAAERTAGHRQEEGIEALGSGRILTAGEQPHRFLQRRDGAGPIPGMVLRHPEGVPDVNETQRGENWQMKIDNARTKLIAVYPKNQL
jgi:hypothetical protein